MRRDDLKPCPFCGSGRVTVWNIRDGQQAVCKECKSTGAPTFHGLDGPKATWGHAVEAWNRREPETDEERCCRVLETIAPPDNGSVQEVLSAALQCANAWVPEARILGNVRAGDLSRALSAALSIEQTQPVKVKALEWREEPIPPTGEALAYSCVGLYCIPLGSARLPLKFRDKVVLGVFDKLEAAKAAAQQDYETRIRSAIVGVAGTSIPADLVERCSEIFGWKESGILTGDKLRGQARAIRENFNCVFDAGEALRQAEEETKREAMRFIITLSTTRIADSAEAGGSATSSKGSDHVEN